MRAVPVATIPRITRFTALPLLLLGLPLAAPDPARASVETPLCAAEVRKRVSDRVERHVELQPRGNSCK